MKPIKKVSDARRAKTNPSTLTQDGLGGGVLFAVRWSESGERNEADEPFSSVSWMHRFQEPLRRYFPSDSRLSGTRQDFAPDRGEL
jgi:hypothetical protein